MAEKTAATVAAEIAAGYETYIARLSEAGPTWEVKPASGEGEEAWCARQVAEHMAGANLFFGSGLAEAIGVPGPALARIQLESAAEGVERTKSTYKEFAAVVAQISDSQMAIEVDHPRLGKQTVGSILGICAYHYADHANQLKALQV